MSILAKIGHTAARASDAVPIVEESRNDARLLLLPAEYVVEYIGIDTKIAI